MPEIKDLPEEWANSPEMGDPGFGRMPGLPPPAASALGGLGDGADEDDDLDEEEDESLGERLLALTEMFPECVQTGTSNVVSGAVSAASWIYTKSRTVLWVVASSGIILALPVMFEHERSQIEEMKMQEQRQLLLGPNAAMSGGPAGSMPGMPPLQR